MASLAWPVAAESTAEDTSAAEMDQVLDSESGR